MKTKIIYSILVDEKINFIKFSFFLLFFFLYNFIFNLIFNFMKYKYSSVLAR